MTDDAYAARRKHQIRASRIEVEIDRLCGDENDWPRVLSTGRGVRVARRLDGSGETIERDSLAAWDALIELPDGAGADGGARARCSGALGSRNQETYMTIESNKRLASYIETELRRLGVEAPPKCMPFFTERGVALLRAGHGPIIGPGQAMLAALVELPDGAGVEAAWSAVASIQDVDAAVERWPQEEAAEGQEEASTREFSGEAIEAERARLTASVVATLAPLTTVERSPGIERGGLAETVALAAETPAPCDWCEATVCECVPRDDETPVRDSVPAPEPTPGAMRPETLRRIEEAVAATALIKPGHGHALLELARVAVQRAHLAEDAAAADEHALRAIAYLVRRLELDAAEEQR